MDKAVSSRIPIVALGIALSAFFAVSFSICILGYLFSPVTQVQHEALSIFLPGFKLLTWGSFFLGLVESIVWGWYIAVVFGTIYNFVAPRLT